MGNTTKQKFADVLEERLKEMPFSKITVAELCKTCGLSRQAFYRQFRDIYDLLNYSHVSIIQLSHLIFRESHNIEESTYYMLESIQKHIYLYKGLCTTEGPNSFFEKLCQSIQYEQAEWIGESNLTESDILSLRIYAIGASQIIIDWINGKVKASTRALAKAINESYPHQLLRYYQESRDTVGCD